MFFRMLLEMHRSLKDVEQDIERPRRFLQEPRGHEEMSEHVGFSQRTLDRYLRQLMDESEKLVRVGTSRPSRYQLIP